MLEVKCVYILEPVFLMAAARFNVHLPPLTEFFTVQKPVADIENYPPRVAISIVVVNWEILKEIPVQDGSLQSVVWLKLKVQWVCPLFRLLSW